MIQTDSLLFSMRAAPEHQGEWRFSQHLTSYQEDSATSVRKSFDVGAVPCGLFIQVVLMRTYKGLCWSRPHASEPSILLSTRAN